MFLGTLEVAGPPRFLGGLGGGLGLGVLAGGVLSPLVLLVLLLLRL